MTLKAIVDSIYCGSLVKQSQPLAEICEPRHFDACVRKAGDKNAPPPEVRPISQDDRENMALAFESPLPKPIPPHVLKELQKTMPRGLDDVMLIDFYHNVGDNMERVRAIAKKLNAGIH
jgi:hypothetical protein